MAYLINLMCVVLRGFAAQLTQALVIQGSVPLTRQPSALLCRVEIAYAKADSGNGLAARDSVVCNVFDTPSLTFMRSSVRDPDVKTVSGRVR